MRGVGGMARAEGRVIRRHYNRAILFGHRRDRVGIVGVGQMFLGVQICGEHEGLPVAWRDESTAAIAYRELMATAAAAAYIEG